MTRGEMAGGVEPHTHHVSNGKRTMDLDELAGLQPGMARFMVEISGRMWKCWWAGNARNAPLARFQLSEAVKLCRMAAFVRPRYAEDMERFLTEQVEPVRDAIAAGDWQRFLTAFDGMVVSANHYHDAYGKGFLVWRIPDVPPPDLDLTPRPRDNTAAD